VRGEIRCRRGRATESASGDFGKRLAIGQKGLPEAADEARLVSRAGQGGGDGQVGRALALLPSVPVVVLAVIAVVIREPSWVLDPGVSWRPRGGIGGWRAGEGRAE
jgi:hypothetical protein